MSFTAHDVYGWLSGWGGGEMALHHADGSGWSDVEELHSVGCRNAVLDSRRVEGGELFVGVPGENTHGAQYLGLALERGATAALVEGKATAVDGARAPVFQVDDGVAALGVIARGYLDRFDPVVAAITGSNGKTTTKDFLVAALRDGRKVGANPGNLNSRLGLPLAVLGQAGDEELLVLEMGASAPGEIAYLAQLAPPRLACITNVAQAHLEKLGSLDGVLETKAALVEAVPPDGVAVLNIDDPAFAALRERCTAERIVTFGRRRDANIRLARCRQTAGGLEVEIAGVFARLPLFGEANGLNAAAACALARELGVAVESALPRIAASALSPHRSRLLQAGRRTVLDDCYNANPSSMRQALESLASLPVPGRRVAVLGSMAELGGDALQLHREVLRRALDLEIDRIVPVGHEMREAATSVGLEDLGVTDLGALSRLGESLARESRPGDAILLKASRSVGLEEVVVALLAALEPRPGGN